MGKQQNVIHSFIRVEGLSRSSLVARTGESESVNGLQCTADNRWEEHSIERYNLGSTRQQRRHFKCRLYLPDV